jgi:hypothetical protein
MCLRRAPEKYIAGAALDRAGLDNGGSLTSYNPTGLHGPSWGQLCFTFTITHSFQTLHLQHCRFRLTSSSMINNVNINCNILRRMRLRIPPMA